MEDIAEKLNQIAEQLNEVVIGLKEVTGYGRRTRRLTTLAIATFCIDVILTFAIGFALHVSQVDSCHTSNEARHGQMIIWHTLVTEFGPVHPSLEQRLKDQRFLNFVDDTFHQLNCPNLYLP